MLITKEHLRSNDMAVQAAIYDSARLVLNKHNYGLVPADDGISSSIKLNFQAETIEVSACRGVTPGGIRIEWQASVDYEPIKLSVLNYRNLLDEGGYYFVVLKVKPFQYVETGEINSSENTQRRPYLMIKPELDLVRFSGVLSDAYSFPIFRVFVENRTIQPDYSYIPPMVFIHGDLRLKYYEDMGRMFTNILNTALQLVRKISGMSNRSQIAVNLHHIAEKIIVYGTGSIDYYNLIAIEQPPIYFINVLIGLIRVLRWGFEAIPEQNSQRLFNYMSHYAGGGRSKNYSTPMIDVNQVVVNNYIDSVLGTQYEHNNISLLVDGIKDCLDFWDTILSKLLQWDYAEQSGKNSWDIH